MRRRRTPSSAAALRRAAALALALVALAGCSSSKSGAGDAAGTAASASSRPSPSQAPPPPPVPDRGACYQLSYDEALAPTDQDPAVPCTQGHTSQTFAVGRLRTTVDGHLLAVDSDAVQQQMTTACPARLADFLGGTEQQLRLSLLRAVWFTPTVAQSDAGAGWYRCDVVAVVGFKQDDDQRLSGLSGDLEGAFASARRRNAYAMCATDQPGTADFLRVVCRAPHSWRAISTVDLTDLAKKSAGAYPGEDAVKGAGDGVCADAARAIAPDALDYQWGYEWPTSAQWAAGQTYGRCWAPDSGGG